ncbi:hypothetical protein Rs2_15539 [Raphanus sativus]|nr:hypothetical protein Rs2_15539 [Raphanus sativus]
MGFHLLITLLLRHAKLLLFFVAVESIWLVAMEKRRVEDEAALTGAKKLKTDSSQMLKTLHNHLDMVVEEVELKEKQLQVLSLKLAEIQKQIEQQTDKLKSTEVEARDKEKALVLIKNQIKSEEKTLFELRTSLKNT